MAYSDHDLSKHTELWLLVRFGTILAQSTLKTSENVPSFKENNIAKTNI
jgi:hypothetical protein